MGDNVFGGKYFPAGVDREFADSDDTLWLQITPLRPNVNNITRRVGAIGGEEVKEESPLWFLMPMEYTYNVQHTWQDLASPSAEMKKLWSKAKNQLNVANADFAGGAFATGHKADNPFLYSNTERRTFNIQFEFSVYGDTQRDVYEPIHKLVEWSTPEIIEDATQFIYPYVFRLQTFTGGYDAVPIISIDKVAITSVTPTYKGPYKDGYPSSALVDIGFTDINPLYRSRLGKEVNRKIGVRSKRTTNNKTFQARQDALSKTRREDLANAKRQADLQLRKKLGIG